MEIEFGSWFRLPRLGKEHFAGLMRAGVEYRQGLFRVGENTDLREVEAILTEALGEQVTYSFLCVVCGKSAGCLGCEFERWSDRRVVSRGCICKNCKEVYEKYVSAFRFLKG